MDIDKVKEIIIRLDDKRMDPDIVRFISLMDIETFVEYCQQISRYTPDEENILLWYARYHVFKDLLDEE